MPILETGYRISDLNAIPTTGIECAQKNKIALDETYMLGYANTIYGIKYNRNNYKIPLKSIRDDIKGYIGIESLVAPWSEQMKFWHGLWNDTANKNRSYVYEWSEEEANHPHYMPEKFADLENSYYIIRNAPFPYETGDNNNRGERGEIIPEVNIEGDNIISTNKPLAAGDPYPESNKLVLKSYVDERLASKRLVDVKTEFWVRDYDCSYVIRANELIEATKNIAPDEPLVIKIHYPDKFEDRVKNNNLEFSLLVEGIETESGANIYKPAIENLVEWELYDSDNKRLNICWLNKTDEDEIIIPNLHEERLYDNARYIIFNFKTVTDSVENFDKIEIVDGKAEKTGEYTKASYSVYAACENMLYRNRAVTTINDKIVEHLHIISSDDSIIIDEKFESGTLITDLKTKPIDISITSPNDSIIINTIKDGNNYSFELDIEKSPEIEILSSSSISVKEQHINNTKYYTIETRPSLIKSNDSILTIIPTKENGWDFFVNLEPADDSIIIDKNGEDGWLIKATQKETVIKAGENISVEKDSEGYIISGTGSGTNIVETKQLVELPDIINFKEVRDKEYKLDTLKAIQCNTADLKTNNVVTTKIYFNTAGFTEDVQLESNVEWAMSNNGSPSFKPNRLYCISITALPNFINAESSHKIIARIEWFLYL